MIMSTYPTTTVRLIDVVVAIHDSSTLSDSATTPNSNNSNLLKFKQGDIIYVLNKNSNGWWDGIILKSSKSIKRGWFPNNFTKTSKYKYHLKQKRKHSISLNTLLNLNFDNISNNSGSDENSNSSSSCYLNANDQNDPNSRRSSASMSPTTSFIQDDFNDPNDTLSYNNFSIDDDQKDKDLQFDTINNNISARRGSVIPSKSVFINPDDKNITILSLQEVEMLLTNSLITNEFSTIPMWSPVLSNDGKKIYYYNNDLNVYCSQLPLFSNSFFKRNNTNSKSEMHLHPKLRSNSTYGIHQEKLPPNSNNINNKFDVNNINNNSSNNQIENSSNSTINKNNNDISNNATVTNLNPPDKDEGNFINDNIKNILISNPNDIFYTHSNDIRLWSELRDLTLYHSSLTHEAFFSNNRGKFLDHFSLTSTFTTYTNIACHLSNYMRNFEDENNTPLQKKIKKLLKKIINSLSFISINSTIYFDSIEFDSWKSLNQSNQTRNISTSTNDTITYINDLPRSSVFSSKKNSLSSGVDLANFNNTQNPSTLTIFELIDLEFNKFDRNITMLYHLIYQANVDWNDNNQMLPQIVPRFVKGSFNGGSWKNPFYNPIINYNFEKVINKTSSLTSSLTPSLVLNAISQNSKLSNVDSFVSSNGSTTVFGSNTGNPRTFSTSISTQRMRNQSSNQSSSYNPLSKKATHSNSISTTNTTFNQPSATSATTSGTKKSQKNKQNSKPFHYTLNNDTLQLIKDYSNNVYQKYFESEDEDKFEALKTQSNKKRNLEITSITYEEISSNLTVIDIMENLDLSIFINLKKLIKNPTTRFDIETEEFLKHSLSSISSMLTEFFDIKQLLHNAFLQLIISTQQNSLDEDPFIFATMKPEPGTGSFEPSRNQLSMKDQVLFHDSNKQLDRRMTRYSMELFRLLISQDVETNGIEFFDTSAAVKETFAKYYEVTTLCCNIVEQLIEERENLLNYSARMMKNDLIVELLKNDQEYMNNSTDTANIRFGNSNKDYDEDIKLISGLLNKGRDVDSDTESDSNSSMKSIASRTNTRFNNKVANLEPLNSTSSYDDTPWYLRSSHEQELLYDSKGQIKGGTKEALIEHLTDHNNVDVTFNITMLLTFRSMFTTLDFIYSLIYRYNLSPPEGLSYEEYNNWISRKLQPIKFNVVNILRTFFSEYWTPSYYEPGLDVILNFASFAVTENIQGAPELLQIIKEKIISNSSDGVNQFDKIPGLDEEVVDRKKTITSNTQCSSNSSDSGPFQSNLFRSKKLKLLDIDAYVYATQLTILEQQLFMKISTFDCLDRIWRSKYCDLGGSENISNFISSANQFTNYVSHSIVITQDVKKRAKRVQYFISVANHCRLLNNFSVMTAIISALYSSPVYRLKKTWQLIPKEYNDILKNLNTLMDSTKNFIKYRQLVESVKDVPCVPFFGVFLSDLTFTSDGNPDFIKGSSHIINFNKRTRIADILRDIMSFKVIHYNLKPNEEIQNYIEHSLVGVPHIEKQYELSLAIEAREAPNSHHNNIRSSRFDLKSGTELKGSKILKFGRKIPSSRLFD
ncbi:hypothetical protein Kpol_414p1 [Vanderwaltozyma polyspora DSM 70294]|uniref:Cell division control protein 25 n=1 Tax=Vanderwaltozyma polyspora (strain ATCC 22028 / DSM 70294 / BCRC 21397 / CBS 2163 / NBRC 10782 / NRRL Y-8283 / UCD 57-17) TaxID=436907 RepID=A7TRY3_VANPO|nr:uncharacterized protein Kpol_414p1 [Vanderwaltozyma polyspora DSM 70294]EDO14968.1 hypothetical protein Kpol_414p1 [Vanderwaltozyma polyspora DSM 70294]